MEWSDLDETLKFIILIGAAVSAMGVLYLTLKRLNRWIQIRYASLEWMFSEEHDHNEIKAWLKDIRGQLAANHAETAKNHNYLSAYMRTGLHAHSKAVFETDTTGAITHVNRAYAQLLGV